MRDAHLRECERMRAAGHKTEAILEFLRQNGASKVGSIGILAKVAGLSLAEAKSVVHASKTWEDVREDHEHFVNDLEEAIEELVSTDDG